jgi:hypothetical protein
MNEFLLGALAMGFFAVALFFRRFWRRTRDRFFALFSLAFLTMSVNQFLLAVVGEDSEFKSWLYVVRLVAFMIILVAIAHKNRD